HVTGVQTCALPIFATNVEVEASLRIDAQHKRLMLPQVLGQGLCSGLRQVHLDALRQQRSGHHENDEQHEHHVDVGHDVDLGHQPATTIQSWNHARASTA